jgi:hypothetical protein
VVILPNWDMSDEDRLDSQRSARRESGRNKSRRLPPKAAKRGMKGDRTSGRKGGIRP